ncbi:MAG TPA: hypothetical protein DCE42_09310 [Myxococcales bacterium]|nr:hypothetical protein [Deltaproteobacteria bacterium]HAA54943.1 hypothetical protein [Myxococcales bacterium]|tara:strand:- start:10194 stop:11018 length:825 start_codon:yes stop_codon:yes gene_type:complete
MTIKELALVSLGRWLVSLWNGLFVEQMYIIQRELDKDARNKFSFGALFLMCWVAVVLTLMEYYGHSGSFLYRWFLAVLPTDTQYSAVYRHVFWSLSCSAGYLLLPAMIIILTPGDRFDRYGLKLKGMTDHLWIYVMLFLIVLPAVIFVSYTQSFQRTYPFYHKASRSLIDLGLWWTFYGIQFFCLEFFFRGYILHGLKRHVGAHAILFSAVPYCMIHFGKPMAETLGAVIAGIALGILSLRTMSVWSGFLIHISVAFAMDLLSLWQKGKFSLFM